MTLSADTNDIPIEARVFAWASVICRAAAAPRWPASSCRLIFCAARSTAAVCKALRSAVAVPLVDTKLLILAIFRLP